MAIDVQALHHLSVVVRDVEVSAEFYTSVLGFIRLKRPDLGFPGVWLGLGPIQMHLIQGEPKSPGTIDSRQNHTALQADDSEKTEAILRERGIEYIRKVQRDSGVVQIFFLDPDGYVLELGSYPPSVPLEQ